MSEVDGYMKEGMQRVTMLRDVRGGEGAMWGLRGDMDGGGDDMGGEGWDTERGKDESSIKS